MYGSNIGTNGLSNLRRVRHSNSQTPILSASQNSQIRGLILTSESTSRMLSPYHIECHKLRVSAAHSNHNFNEVAISLLRTSVGAHRRVPGEASGNTQKYQAIPQHTTFREQIGENGHFVHSVNGWCLTRGPPYDRAETVGGTTCFLRSSYRRQMLWACLVLEG